MHRINKIFQKQISENIMSNNLTQEPGNNTEMITTKNNFVISKMKANKLVIDTAKKYNLKAIRIKKYNVPVYNIKNENNSILMELSCVPSRKPDINAGMMEVLSIQFLNDVTYKEFFEFLIKLTKMSDEFSSLIYGNIKASCNECLINIETFKKAFVEAGFEIRDDMSIDYAPHRVEQLLQNKIKTFLE